MTSDANIYPRLLRRVRAVLIDSVLIGVIFVAWLIALPRLGDLHYAMKLAVFIVPIVLLEPALVSLTGGTPGHHLMKLRIRDAAHDSNIGFLRATVRAVIRAFLGWLSFVFVLITRKHQALHDYATPLLFCAAPRRCQITRSSRLESLMMRHTFIHPRRGESP
jgi:uncharacterized RDD family membrane protein YckC